MESSFSFFSDNPVFVSSDDHSDLRPEELLRGLNPNTRDIHASEDVAEFLREWSDSREFVEDLEYVVRGFSTSDVGPEEVFEHLVESDNLYTVEQMIDAADELGEGEWSRPPKVKNTGTMPETFLSDKISVPREFEFNPRPQGHTDSSRFRDEGKEVWLEQHSDGWYQSEIKALNQDEVLEFFQALEEQKSSRFLHEVIYGDCPYFLDSVDIQYFFRFQEDIDEFDQEVYRIESDFDDFMLDISKIPESSEYRAMIFCKDGHEYPLKAFEEVTSERLVQGMKSRLRLQEKVYSR